MAKPNRNAAQPGQPAPKAKKEKTPKVWYPGLNVQTVDGKETVTTPLTEYPTDFDPKVHKPLNRKSFTNEAPLLKRQAEKFRQKADALDKEAATIEKLGSADSRGKAKKLAHAMSKMDEIRAQLVAEIGEDGVAEMMAMLQSKKAAAPAAAEAPVVAE
jgi:hypothetical protein